MLGSEDVIYQLDLLGLISGLVTTAEHCTVGMYWGLGEMEK